MGDHNTQVFISYSRKDAAFARKLTDALEKSEMELWIDWYSIPPTADWMRQIEKGIEGAQGFLFLLSPDSVKSEVCTQEIDHAIKNGKRLIPVVARDVDPKEIHPALAKLNRIFFREADDFDASLQKLLTAIKTDLEWVEAHRDLQVKALEWDENKDTSLLLRGRELKESEEQLAEAGTKDPQPTDLQRRFVLESRKRETRTRNITATISAAAMIVLAIASVIAIIQGNNAIRQAQIAEEQAQIALSRQLAAQASNQMDDNYDLSALLSVEAFNHADTIEARSILLRARVNASLEKKRLRDEQRKLFRTFATAEVAEELLEKGFSLGRKYVEATAMFTDIRSLTSIAEAHDPAEIIELLNNYFALIFGAIVRHKGTVNQMVGDGLMAVFGTPIHREDHCEQAVLAALDLLEGFNQQQAALKKSQIKIVIGISSGKMIAGYTGTEYRAVYTCVGDAVNLAARLEDYTKQAGKPILIDRNTCDRLADSITVEALGQVLFKGKQQPVQFFFCYKINPPGRHNGRLFSYNYTNEINPLH